ncbi:hypothetical protein M422DRAFT_250350 [Sphaerobolus stellatus SS14]|uniref:SMP-30/Gluconolactonase/LRE-like region domain-containing protein n=1 Tax=Sphaerobolus stellatus (strain SS14) TaxID=990650 RepID=A0A0C9W4I6_SPHS4|nr:hypothetical protein M422DRAFT_250350 [Sphaerobolus stellatus SS14]
MSLLRMILMKKASCCISVILALVGVTAAIQLPSQTVFMNVPEFAVLGDNGTFRTSATPFNPQNLTPPFFQVWDLRFLDILGPKPRVRIIAERDDFEFAHEAPIWDPIQDQVFFASANIGPPLGNVNFNHNNDIFVIQLKDVKDIPGPQNITWTKVPITPDIQVVNGGTPMGHNLLFVTNGRANISPGVAIVNPRPPFNSTTLLDNFHGRQFNSLDDVRVHPKSGAIFFTDSSYGFIGGFRPPPLLPNQVYRFDPKTSEVHLVADGFQISNGITFSPDGNIAYVSDTGSCCSAIGFNSTQAATIYAFDVDPTTQRFLNRRVFLWSDSGIPDGFQTDSKGNLYASTADGVQVYDPTGVLLGKIFVGSNSANNVFAGKGRMVVMAETKLLLVEFEAEGSLVDLE